MSHLDWTIIRIYLVTVVKIIFLTGGSSGIGRDCAKAYAAEGAKVVVAALDEDRVEGVASELGGNHLGLVCDVSRNDQVKTAIERTLSRYGKLDAVHNNAGIASPSKSLHETTDAEWDALFDVNLKSVLHTTRHAYAALVASKGCILNTSSLVGVIGQEIHAAYTATKGAMNYCPEGDTVADACVFLISEKARFITGHITHISGGAELGYRHPGRV